MIKKIKSIFTKEYSEDTFGKSGNPDNKYIGKRSAAYQRHFEGFNSIEEKDARGNVHSVRVYTGTWYEPDLSGKQCVFLKIAYTLIWIFCAADLMFFSTRQIAVNTTWYCALSQAAIAGSLLWTLTGLVNYLILPHRRTIGEWRSSNGTLKKSTIAATAVFGLSFIINLVYLLFYIDRFGMQLLCILACFAGTLLMFLWNRLESNVTYIEVPGDAAAETGMQP